MSKKSSHEENSICNIHNSIVLYYKNFGKRFIFFKTWHLPGTVYCIAVYKKKKKHITDTVYYANQVSVQKVSPSNVCVLCAGEEGRLAYEQLDTVPREMVRLGTRRGTAVTTAF